ncbi:MAG TPA: 3'-5' exonuclease [Candidatus Paceibacterota bacterium]|nr:3'-5' exonuclease [Candidatus Paceibacterota bacterium]
MKDINILSLDLEMNQPSGSIIQVGAVVGNLKTGDILEELSVFIHTNETLEPFIIKLTGIKQNDVDNGYHLFNAYEKLCDLHKKYNCFRNCLTWGGDDTNYLKKQLFIKDDELFLFGRRWIDVKTIYVSSRFAQDLTTQGGLARSLGKMGLQFKGKKHNAKDDAKNTFIIYRELLKKMVN